LYEWYQPSSQCWQDVKQYFSWFTAAPAAGAVRVRPTGEM
jgi:hypothetical protein